MQSAAATITAHVAPGGELELEVSIGEDRVEYVRLPVAATWCLPSAREFPGVDTANVAWAEARYAYAVPVEETAVALVARLRMSGEMRSEPELLTVWDDGDGAWELWTAQGELAACAAWG